ncbi:MAG: PorT family protein [Muribaculaceae bacterium]
MSGKVIFAIVVAAACGVNAGAQRLRLGVEGGLNVSRPINADGARVGFNVGLKGDLDFNPATDSWYFDMALKLSSKPSSSNSNVGWFGADGLPSVSTGCIERMTPYYLEIPIHAGYHFNLSRKVKAFASFGPYFAVGLFGPSTVSTFVGDGKWVDFKIDNVFKATFNNDAMRRFDAGISVRLGAELIDHVQIAVGYDLGFVEYNNTLNNQTISLSAAYMF